MKCRHSNLIGAIAAIKHGPEGQLLARIAIVCKECDRSFCFLGLPDSADELSSATSSPDRTMAFLPIVPQGEVFQRVRDTLSFHPVSLDKEK